MAAEITPEVVQKDQARAEKFANKHLEKRRFFFRRREPKVDNPLARFNLEQTQQVPTPDRPELPMLERQHDWQPREGLPQLPSFDAEAKKAAEELKHPEKIEDPETKQKFQVVKLNWDKKEANRGKPETEQTRPILYVPEFGWSASAEGPIQLRLKELVKQTGRPVFSIDHPGMGSDSLTRNQKRALKTDNGYSMIAEAELRVMQKMGIKELDIVGFSMGGWAAASLAEMAEKYDIKVRNLVAIDSPGVAKKSALGLIRGETSEAKALELQQSIPYDKELREAAGHYKSKFRRHVDMLKWGIHGMKDGGLKYIRSMGRKTLGRHLGKALEANPDLHVQIMNGSESKVSPAEANVRLVKNAQRTLAQVEGGKRIHQSIFSGDSHSLMENPQRFAAMVKLAMQPSKEVESVVTDASDGDHYKLAA